MYSMYNIFNGLFGEVYAMAKKPELYILGSHGS